MEDAKMETANALVKRLLSDILEDSRKGLSSIVARSLHRRYGPNWRATVLATYQDRHAYQGDACANDLTGDAGVLFSVILQEWAVVRRDLPGCRHWVDLLKGFRNVWAHASGLGLPVAAAAYVVANELGERAGFRNLRQLRARRDHILRVSSREALATTRERMAGRQIDRRRLKAPIGVGASAATTGNRPAMGNSPMRSDPKRAA
jgi:hypothetical protein